jgi:hypothetical protein
VYKARLLSIIFALSALLTPVSSLADSSAYKLLEQAFSAQTSAEVKIQNLKKVLEYTKITNKIITDKELKLLIENAPKVSKDYRVLVLRIMNNSKRLEVLEHYSEILEEKENLIYKFYMISSIKTLKIDIDQSNEALFERYELSRDKLNNNLIKYLDHKNPNIRFVTIGAVGYRNIKSAAKKLISQFASEEDQICTEISKSLISLSAKDELKESLDNQNQKIRKWAKLTLNRLIESQSEAMAHLKSRSVIHSYITIHQSSKDEEIKKKIKEYTETLENDESLLKTVVEIGNYSHNKTPRNVKLDSRYVTLCESSYEAILLYPKTKLTSYNLDKFKKKQLTCRTFMAKKYLSQAKFYLSKAQRRRNENSVNSAIAILSKLLLNYKLPEVELNASILLAKGYLYAARKEECKDLVLQIKEVFKEKLTKEQKKDLEKILRKVN